MPPNSPQLRDIHLPPEPSWWPPAPGWWLLTLLAIATLMWAGRWLRRRLRRRRRDRLILAELTQIHHAWIAHRDDAQLLAELSTFLRRLGRVVDPASVTLTATAWLEFLDRHGDGFRGASGEALLQAAYQKDPKVDTELLWTIVQKHTRRVLATELAHV